MTTSPESLAECVTTQRSTVPPKQKQKMQKANTDNNAKDDKPRASRPKRTISFKRTNPAFPETNRNRKRWEKSLSGAPLGHANQPINLRFQQFKDLGQFSRPDPLRPIRSHAKLACNPSIIHEEINALTTLLWVNTCSIARRTSEPQELMWPLIQVLALLVNEYFDERSEYEMYILEEGLRLLEFSTYGKIRFSRSGE